MIATQIFFFMVVLISSVHFITCPSAPNGSAVKPDMGKFALKDKSDTNTDPQNEGEKNKSNLEKKTIIQNVLSKSVGLICRPITKSWNIFKGIIPLPRSIFSGNKIVKKGNTSFDD